MRATATDTIGTNSTMQHEQEALSSSNWSNIASPMTSSQMLKSSLSPAVISGIAVSCAVAAAALTALVFWLLIPRRTAGHHRAHHNQRNTRKHSIPSFFYRASLGHSLDNLSPTSFLKRPDPSALVKLLPPICDDKEVKTQMSNMFANIKRHVGLFYHNDRIKVPNELLEDMAKFNSPNVRVPIADMLAKTTRPRAAILKALTEMVTKSIEARTSENESLLPIELVAVYRAMSDETFEHAGPPLFWHRMLLAHLYPCSSSSLAIKHAERVRDEVILSMISNVQAAFNPWRSSKFTDDEETLQLFDMLKSVAEVGKWLLRQRCGFEIRWGRDVPTGNLLEGGLEIRPAVVNVVEADGRALGRTTTLIQRQVVKMVHGELLWEKNSGKCFP